MGRDGDEAAVRRAVVVACRRLVDAGLVVGSAGNVSVRLDAGRILVTPAGLACGRLTADDLVTVDLERGTATGARPPTSELALHRGIVRARPDVGAIVHTHSPYAAAHAVTGTDIPFICNESLANRAEKVLVTAPYAPPGSEGLAGAALATFARQPGSRAVLLANHGVVAVADDLDTATTVAQQIEWLARIHHHAALLGEVRTIPREDMLRMAATYGVALALEEPLREEPR